MIDSTVRVEDSPDRLAKEVTFKFVVPDEHLSDVGGITGHLLSNRSYIGAVLALCDMVMLAMQIEEKEMEIEVSRKKMKIFLQRGSLVSKRAQYGREEK